MGSEHKTHMSYTTWIKSKDLRVWADTLESRQKLPALVRRLIHATVENPSLVQFPADEGTQRRGWDGVLEIENGNAWVPKGRSVWEMGVDQDPTNKANTDYTKRTAIPGGVNTSETTFVFVTPRKWEGKTEWLEGKRKENKWLNVLVWDCDDLEQWLETAPSTDAWLARLMGKLHGGVRDLSNYWQNLAATSSPPLTPAVFLAGRTKAEKDLLQALAGPPAEIVVNALSLSELRDFVSAIIGGNDDESENAALARALVVETADAWNHLSTTKNRLLLIPSDHLALEKPMVAEAVKTGHHVLTQRPYTVIRASTGIRLPRADRFEIQKALENAGFSDERATRLAREAGGCLSVLVRLASRFAAQATPAWSKPHEAGPFLPLVLLGAWSDRNDDDRKLVERFTGEPYANTQQLATRWMNQSEGPLRFAEGVYSFVSREDSWLLFSPYFTNDLLNRFAEIANEILGEDDPRFEMPAGERYLAGIHKKLPKFSPQLREGIAETIALLGTRGDHTPQGTTEGSSWRAARLVSQFLEQAPPKRWFSLSSNLPLLAEAAPDEFLSALESSLKQSPSAITALFEKNADGIFASSPHTSLMWALGLLAWDTAHVSRAVLVLAVLIKLDTGGRINPRPAGVMHGIFRFWYPQTSATIDERLQVLDLLAKREPDVAWSLILGLIPQAHDTAMPSYKPRWRDCDTSQTKEITYGDIGRQAEWAAARLVKIAEAHHEKWPLLLKDFSQLPSVAKDATLKWLRDVDVASMSSKAHTEIWEQIRELVQQHRFFCNAQWAMPKSTLDDLAEIEKRLMPTDPIARSQWLFQSGTFHSFGNTETPHEERERLYSEAQAQAVQEVFAKVGLEGVFTLGSTSHVHVCMKIGECLAKSGLLPDWSQLLPEKLVSEAEHERSIALGYATTRRNIEGDAWVEGVPLEEWSAEAVGEFALTLNFDRSTWQMLRRRKPDAEIFYWRRVHPWAGKLPCDELEEAVRSLLENGRPVVALDAISTAIQNHKTPSWKIVAETVDLASTSPANATDGGSGTMFVWQICEAMKYLQADPTADQEQLAVLEWRLLSLARHDHFTPKTLHLELSRDAGFFAQVLSLVYRAKGEAKDEIPDPIKQNIAEAGHNLIESWTGIPGAKLDGFIDAAVLSNWIAEARKICIGNGRIGVCDSKMGEQLSYAPPDADGSWPCETVRDVLETTTTNEIMRGFCGGVFNQHGMTFRGMSDGGEQERDLATKYRAFAEKCKVAWPRTALALRQITEYYERQANREDEHAEARD